MNAKPSKFCEITLHITEGYYSARYGTCQENVQTARLQNEGDLDAALAEASSISGVSETDIEVQIEHGTGEIMDIKESSQDPIQLELATKTNQFPLFDSTNVKYLFWKEKARDSLRNAFAAATGKEAYQVELHEFKYVARICDGMYELHEVE